LALLSTLSGSAAQPAQITLGAPHRKESPAVKFGPAFVVIEVPAKITNTSKQAIICNDYDGQPDYLQYICRNKNSAHWTDISFKGRCGLSSSTRTLKPGESVDSSVVVVEEKTSGKRFRLGLPIITSASDNKTGIKIYSNTITLP
jgi:hypothetical protein